MYGPFSVLLLLRLLAFCACLLLLSLFLFLYSLLLRDFVRSVVQTESVARDLEGVELQGCDTHASAIWGIVEQGSRGTEQIRGGTRLYAGNEDRVRLAVLLARVRANERAKVVVLDLLLVPAPPFICTEAARSTSRSELTAS